MGGGGGWGGSISTSAVSTLFLNQSIMSPAVLQKCTTRPADGFCGWIWLKKPSLDQVNHLKEIPELTRGLNSRCGLSCPKSPGWTSVYWCSRQGGYKCRAHSKDLSSSIMIYLDLCSDLWCKAQVQSILSLVIGCDFSRTPYHSAPSWVQFICLT